MQLEALSHREAECLIEGLAGQGGNQRQSVEPRNGGGSPALLEQPAPYPLARHGRIHEEGPDSGRLGLGVQQRVLPLFHLIAAKERPPAAPPAGPHQPPVPLSHQVSTIVDQLSIGAEHKAEKTLDLRGGVVPVTEDAG